MTAVGDFVGLLTTARCIMLFLRQPRGINLNFIIVLRDTIGRALLRDGKYLRRTAIQGQHPYIPASVDGVATTLQEHQGTISDSVTQHRQMLTSTLAAMTRSKYKPPRKPNTLLELYALKYRLVFVVVVWVVL